MHERKGSARRVVGWLTGDRRVEAEGRLEERRGEVPDDKAVEAEEIRVKRDHFDYGREGKPVPDSER